jgi:predicted O-methyltransferase YrrM
MYSKFTLGRKYFLYLLKAKELHGVHSPFVFSFSNEVLYKKTDIAGINRIEEERNSLLKNNSLITITDLGAGSRILKSNTRTIKSIAKTSLKPKKWARLLYNIHAHFKPKTSIELGTSLGITTSYISLAMGDNTLHTIEGSEAVYKIANEVFKNLGLKNIKNHLGNFDTVLPKLVAEIKSAKNKIDILYIDGNHQYAPTVNYFETCIPLLHNNSIVIFDDIHWSKEMEEAWEYAKTHESITITIDLFFIGIVFFRKEKKEKEHFILKY